MAWKKIGCATDLSETSRAALLEAAELARGLGAELTLLHVYQAPSAASDDMLVSAPELYEMAAHELNHTMQRWGGEAERLAGRKVKVIVLAGEPGPELLRYAAEARLDALVVGTHGRRGLSRLVLGSVAEHLAREAACAVVVVRPAGGGEGAQGYDPARAAGAGHR